MLKCFFAIGAAAVFVFGCAGDVSGADKVTGNYTDGDVDPEELKEVNAAFSKFGYSGPRSANLELKGIWEIKVAALDFEISDVTSLDMLEQSVDGRPSLKDNLRLCIIKAKYPTMAKVTLTSLNAPFREGKHHFLKVADQDGGNTIYLHKTKTEGQIVIGPEGVGVYGGLTKTECTGSDDLACKNDAVPAGDDLSSYFPDLINKDTQEVDISAQCEIKVEATATE